jgi:hypothetical protein
VSRATKGRRERVRGGRHMVRKVRVTPAENGRLEQLAAGQAVSVPRLLVESALAEDGWTITQRRALIAEWDRAVRQLVGVATNVNQIAYHANAAERFPGVVAYSTLPRIEDAIERLNAAVEGLRRP